MTTINQKIPLKVNSIIIYSILLYSSPFIILFVLSIIQYFISKDHLMAFKFLVLTSIFLCAILISSIISFLAKKAIMNNLSIISTGIMTGSLVAVSTAFVSQSLNYIFIVFFDVTNNFKLNFNYSISNFVFNVGIGTLVCSLLLVPFHIFFAFRLQNKFKRTYPHG